MKLRSGLFSIFCVIVMMPTILLVYSMNCTVRKNINIWLIVMIAVIDIVAIVMLIWIYKRLLLPLDKLQNATRQIAEGNLDYELNKDDFEEISFLYNDFEKMRLRLKGNEEENIAAEKAVRELVSNISHDLKTPLTAIRGYVEGILDGVASSPEKIEKYLKTIYKKTNDMTTLIDELIYYSQVARDKIFYNFEKINVKEFFDDYAKDITLELETRNIIFLYTSNVNSSTIIEMDKEQIKRVLNNIFSNSVKYLDKEYSHIYFTVKEMLDMVCIEISDNGRGISRKDLPHIFERFYRSDMSRNTNLGGSGIGLSIVKKVVEDHGGDIIARSKLGIGTDIVIALKKQ